MCIYCEGYKEEDTEDQSERTDADQEQSSQLSTGRPPEGVIGTLRSSISNFL